MLHSQLLLVEDDSELAGSLADYLAEFEFDVDFAFNGQSCLDRLALHSFDIIVMDVAMPGIDGLQACRQIRRSLQLSTPILFLTARDTLADKIEGFDAGGDDYLVKPFAPEELLLRLRALLKRSRPIEVGELSQCGPLTFDHQLLQVIREQQVISLHELQFKLLLQLALAAPEPVTREQLASALWRDQPPDSDALRTHIYRLRKLLDKPFADALIQTQHGKGYRLAIPR